MLAKSLAKILAKIACKKRGYGRVFFRGEKGGLFRGLISGASSAEKKLAHLKQGTSQFYKGN